MTWEETIQYIRKKPEFKELVEKAYFEEKLEINVERFRISEEYLETKALINQFLPNAKNILDIGSGNGISAISFALDGWDVTVAEPNNSETIGGGAIRKLKEHYLLNNIEIFEEFAENINFGNKKFDIVYVRQAMHHAYNLDKFITNISSYLKPSGLLITLRDHIVFNEKDKAWFLENHPLHKYYGGENAFTEKEYIDAFKNAGLHIEKKLKHFDSVINFFPITRSEFEMAYIEQEAKLMNALRNKIGKLAHFPLFFNLYKWKNGFSRDGFFDERKVPGRMYSFICSKTL
jgi:2-polyprenyl-3-methyl-5-hydroxy-6-metoxy-1,4-benzoquinol methylase